MMPYQSMIDILEAELAAVSGALAELSTDDWRCATRLAAPSPDLPNWTVTELAGHLDIAIGRTRILIAESQDAEPAMDGASFFIRAGSQIAPVFYTNARRVVEGKTPATVLGMLVETFRATVAESRAVPADLVGPAIFAPMRVDEFVRSRIAEAVVHGIDLALALDLPVFATQEGISATAAILDDLLALRTGGHRPQELANELAWVLAASGRSRSPHDQLPLLS